MSSDPADPANPTYYRAGGMEAADVADAFELSRWLTMTLKYILRAGKKGDAVVDLRKAIWTIEREISLRSR